MRKLKVIFLVILIFLGTSACSMDKKSEVEGDITRTAIQTKEGYYDISPQEAKKRLDSEKDIILLDVRTVEEYTEKHIPKSLLIPVTDIEKVAPVKLTNKEAIIIVYCRSGNRSVTASIALVKMGYKNVYNLGGINSWTYETESGAPK